MPYIIKKNTTVPDGVVQVKDLWPNKSQANAVIDPKPYGFRYINGPQNTALTSSIASASAFLQECSGLSAYLLCNVSASAAGQGVGNAVTVAQANALATAIIGVVTAGGALTAAAINGLAAQAVFADVTAGNVSDILSILAGASYVVPAGHVYKNTVNDDIILPTSSFFVNNEARLFDSSFYISNAVGDISVMKSSSFVYLDTSATPPANTTGALLTVYNDDGALA